MIIEDKKKLQLVYGTGGILSLQDGYRRRDNIIYLTKKEIAEFNKIAKPANTKIGVIQEKASKESNKIHKKLVKDLENKGFNVKETMGFI